MKIAPGSTLGDPPLLAICMATYNPESLRLARQIESILCQTYPNWLLIISDDASDQADWREIEALCNLDPRRIRLVRHQDKLGFYHNFERALNYVPANAELIAFADQDDEWYPEKLRRLVATLNDAPGAMLVYSDMRIVAQSGKVISDTYWVNRKNEYRDFTSVFLSNTVTGAAALFKRELLDVLLPFPARVGGAFHDHWLACTAMCSGQIAYLAEPLYDYIQYPDSVIGHCDQQSNPLFADKAKRTGPPVQTDPAASHNWQTVYRQDCLRLQLLADTLKSRFPDKANNFTLNLMNGGGQSVLKLAYVSLRGILKRDSTARAASGLMMGFLRGAP